MFKVSRSASVRYERRSPILGLCTSCLLVLCTVVFIAVHVMFTFFLCRKKVLDLKSVSSNHGDEAVINRHLVHSSFKGWEHLNDYFLAVLIQRLFSTLEQRGEVLNAHLKYLQAFSVCILYFTSKLFLQNNISLNSCVPSCRISLIIVHLPCGASPTNLH